MHARVCVCVCVAQLCLTLCDPIVLLTQAKLLLPMGFPKQEYWSELPFPSPGDHPDLGSETSSPTSPALADGFFTTLPPGKAPEEDTIP